MGNGSGVSRGDRNRNARLERLRALVPVTNAIAGIDLAGKKQMVVVTDHDSKVIARRTFRCRAWDLGSALDWAADRAAAAGWAGVTVSCRVPRHRPARLGCRSRRTRSRSSHTARHARAQTSRALPARSCPRWIRQVDARRLSRLAIAAALAAAEAGDHAQRRRCMNARPGRVCLLDHRENRRQEGQVSELRCTRCGLVAQRRCRRCRSALRCRRCTVCGRAARR
jgi:hypothetical protein